MKFLLNAFVCTGLSAQILMPIASGTGGGGGGGGGGGTYTFVTYAYLAETAASTTSITSPALTLAAGDFVMWFCRNSGANTVSVSSTPANTVGSLPQVNWNSATAAAMFGYILSAIAGSTTFTCSYATAATYTSMVVLQYHHSGAAPGLDAQVGNSFTSNATATSAAFNTTGNPGLVIMCATWGSLRQIMAGVIGGSTATLRGVSQAVLTSTTADSGCEDASFASPQSGITATMSVSAALNGAYLVGVFK